MSINFIDLLKQAGARRQDGIISPVQIPRENWSFGNGEAQDAPPLNPSGVHRPRRRRGQPATGRVLSAYSLFAVVPDSFVRGPEPWRPSAPTIR